MKIEKTRFEEPEFVDFLSSILRNGSYSNGTKEHGILMKAKDYGYKLLSEKQKYVLEQAIKPYYIEECSFCSQKMPWDNMDWAAEDRGGKCYYCDYMLSKD